MYLDFYQLSETPFNVTPDPRFLYMTEQHASALNHLLFGIRQRKGFVLLTGEVGTGKTTICRKLLESFDDSVQTALILNPVLSPTQLLRAIAEEFGADVRGRDRLSYLTGLNNYLLDVCAAGQEAVLIIDEAQDMPTDLLENVRLLSNLETDSRKLLQIVLAGQPELRAKLRQPSLRQLAQRITVRAHLQAMDESDTREYLRHRMATAGADGSSGFDPEAVRRIHEFSGGTPRLVNAAADKALLAGYVSGSRRIDERIATLGLDELREAA
jgi:general secretion pathway protein A